MTDDGITNTRRLSSRRKTDERPANIRELLSGILGSTPDLIAVVDKDLRYAALLRIESGPRRGSRFKLSVPCSPLQPPKSQQISEWTMQVSVSGPDVIYHGRLV